MLLASVFSLLLIEAVVLVPSYRYHVKQLQADVVRDGQEALRHIQLGLQLPIGEAAARSLFEAVATYEPLLGFVIVDNSGDVLHHSGQPVPPMTVAERNSLPLNCCAMNSLQTNRVGDLTYISARTDTSTEPRFIRLVLDASSVSARATEYLLRVLLLVAIICLCLILSLVWVMGRYATSLKYEAYHDALTGLPNRRFLLEHLEQQFRALQPLHLLAIDLDEFSAVRERWGSHSSNQLLQQVAERLSSELPRHAILSRFRDDKFTLAIPEDGLTHGIDPELLRLRQCIERPVMIAGETIAVTACIGLNSIQEVMQTRAEEALGGSELALSAAKRQGTGQVHRFDEAMRAAREQRTAIITGMRTALAEQQLSLHYQPLVHTADQRIVDVESLLRWQHPTLGPVSPAIFIPYAEETGIIVEYGSWVLQQALVQYKAWLNDGLVLSGISVNLSPRQFTDEQLVPRVRQLIELYDIAPGGLKLEVTESAVITHPQVAIRKMSELSEVGVHFAIDDFGTGYSSLSNLGTFPFTDLKIDQSFIRQIESSPPARSIIRTCIQLAHDLGMKVTAEGVEQQSEFDFLAETQCDLIQGYYFSKPLCATAFAEALRQQQVVGIVNPRRAA